MMTAILAIPVFILAILVLFTLYALFTVHEHSVVDEDETKEE